MQAFLFFASAHVIFSVTTSYKAQFSPVDDGGSSRVSCSYCDEIFSQLISTTPKENTMNIKSALAIAFTVITCGVVAAQPATPVVAERQIGRASCRERV